jgi:hypothetical protein
MLGFGKQELSGEGFTLTAEHLFLRFVSLHSSFAARCQSGSCPAQAFQLRKHDLKGFFSSSAFVSFRLTGCYYAIEVYKATGFQYVRQMVSFSV